MILHMQNAVLEMIAKGVSLSDTARELCLRVEAAMPRITASILSFDGNRLHTLAGPSLPAHYSAAIDKLEAGPLAGSCGTAAYFGQAVAVRDIDSDPRWRDYRALALPLGFRACWSSPIKSGDRVLGTFAFYYKEICDPSAWEQDLVDACVHLCAIAIEREERVIERRRLTYLDALTGLQNRASFNEALALASSTMRDQWGLLLADIDNLKIVNDTFGHSAGDSLIQTVGARLAETVGGAYAFRLGGDEFAAILPLEGGEDLDARAASILDALSFPATCDGHVVFPGATIGGAVAAGRAEAEEVRRFADIALYHAKEHSRGQYVRYSLGLGTALTRRFRAVRDVGLALAQDRLLAYYQPIVLLDTLEVVGFEALCRMVQPGGEVVSAAHFHEATKDAHVSAGLTRRMLEQVARDMRAWLDVGLPLQHVGINLSAVDFRGGKLHQMLCSIFGKAGVPLDHLILEVTESVYLGHRDHRVGDEINALRAEGLKVALDDFGTGYASLTHLLTVPVDIIKIDKSFIDRLVSGDGSGFIVEGLLGIAKNLGVGVVAEGIETQAQAERLRELGCRLGQGYLFSKAMDGSSASAYLARHGQRPGGAYSGAWNASTKPFSKARY